MPAKSQKQRKAAGVALSAKRGKMPKGALKGAAKGMMMSMSESELSKMASMPKGMPPKGMHKMPGGHMMKDSEMKKMMGGKSKKK